MKFLKVKTILFGLAAATLSFMGLSKAPTTVYAAEDMKAVYSVYQYQKGWSGESGDNTYCQAPADSYVTALRATLRNQPAGMTGTITYQVNLSGSGWLDWDENYALTGTTTTSMPLESIRMQLSGELKDHYDLYYSVLQSGKWTDPVMNGAKAGAEGCGLRVDGIRVAVTKKGEALLPPQAAAIRDIDPTKPMIALTYDDGPSKNTEKILNVLEANNARATFFMVGNRIASYSSYIPRMAELGCEFANHTWAHTYLTKLSPEGMNQSLDQLDAALVAAGGTKTHIMRPPGGFVNQTAKDTFKKRNTPMILWSIDTLDWKTRDAQKTVSAILDHVKDGDIVLMHDLYSATADASEIVIPELIRRGYQLVTVSEMAALRGGMTGGEVYTKFPPAR